MVSLGFVLVPYRFRYDFVVVSLGCVVVCFMMVSLGFVVVS